MMFYKKEVEKLLKRTDELNDRINNLERELKEKTTMSYSFGSWLVLENRVSVKDVVKDIVEKMGYRFTRKVTPENVTYIEKKPEVSKRKEVNK